MHYKNFFTFEGGEGTGKSSAITEIAQRLTAQGYEVMVTREPGGIPISEKIREIILDVNHKEMTSETEALLYAASRAQHLYQKILPALEAGKIVICDRYLDSSLAYQGIARELGLENVEQVNLYALAHLPMATYFIDVEPRIALSRILQRTKRDRLDLETLSFHQKVYDGYLLLADKYQDRYVCIRGDQALEDMIEEIYQDLMKKIIA